MEITTLGVEKGTKNRPNVTVGDKWNKLTVLAEAGLVNHVRFVKCACDCGKIVTASASLIKRGSRVSCGCYTRGIMRGRRLNKWRSKRSKDESARHALYTGYKAKAAEYSREFKLTYHEFETLTTSPCIYCGSEPYQEFHRNRKAITPVYCRYTGVDRNDSAVGYISSNVVPCCVRCNAAKNDMLPSQFAAWIVAVHSRIALFNSGIIPDLKTCGNVISNSWKPATRNPVRHQSKSAAVNSCAASPGVEHGQ